VIADVLANVHFFTSEGRCLAVKIRLLEWVSLELSLIDVLVSAASFIMQGSSTQLLLWLVICCFLGEEDANTLPTVLAWYDHQ